MLKAEREEKLQFGHGGEAVEMSSSPIRRVIVSTALQFGHGGEAVEISLALVSSVLCAGASIRPRR